jgi:hypothetical protein
MPFVLSSASISSLPASSAARHARQRRGAGLLQVVTLGHVGIHESHVEAQHLGGETTLTHRLCHEHATGPPPTLRWLPRLRQPLTPNGIGVDQCQGSPSWIPAFAAGFRAWSPHRMDYRPGPGFQPAPPSAQEGEKTRDPAHALMMSPSSHWFPANPSRAGSQLHGIIDCREPPASPLMNRTSDRDTDTEGDRDEPHLLQRPVGARISSTGCF